ncbi:MAG: hypothetical protein IK145_01365 [Bacteroidales bacterium]|nr:hypothetical protein [Bacteroidales bacterium]
MRIKPLLLLLSAALFFGCSSKGSLEQVAREHIQAKVFEAMGDRLGAVGEPEIKDIQVLYDCDSLCILQCRALSKDAEGNDLSGVARYIFAKDPFLSRANGKPAYCDAALGSEYLDSKGIKEFRKKMEDNGSDIFFYYLAMCEFIR